MKTDEVIIHGHRGYRGLYPENTIGSFMAALEVGVQALEMDVVLTADNKILVSHDPFMHHEICLKPDSTEITAAEEESYNIYKMTVAEAQSYIMGGKPHPRFAQQKQVRDHKPTLKELVVAVNNRVEQSKGLQHTPWFNIEIKSQPEWDDEMQPKPAEYVRLFLADFKPLNISNNTIIQSFDARILEELHKQQPNLKLVYLSEDSTKTAEQKLAELTFKPYGYSPNFAMVNEQVATYCKENDLELIVWTVNEEADIKRVLSLGIKQIISDYPERVIQLSKKL
jgi:glycerophosphoryl diester phosphodiesterase